MDKTYGGYTMEHAFVICAYLENPNLQETIQSLLSQTRKSEIFISTSTPNEFVRTLAEKYQIPLLVNPESKGSGSDWNFAFRSVDAKYITLAHQDDIYEPTFAEKTLQALKDAKDPIIAYTEYYELRGEEHVTHSGFLKIKQHMNRTISLASRSRALRRIVLGFGFSICCPAITYHKQKIKNICFRTDYQNSHDWEAICRLAKLPGEFVYIPEQLLGHRIYTESQTTKSIVNGTREREDMEILYSIWPVPVAKAIMHWYRKSLDNNS